MSNIAMAMHLASNDIDAKKITVKKGHSDILLKKQIEKLALVKKQDANEIIDNIYERAVDQNEQLYQYFKSLKDRERNKADVKKVDHSKIKNKVQSVIKRAQNDSAALEEFHQMPYFKQFEMKDAFNFVSKKNMNQAKLDGRFEVKIKKHLSGAEQALCYAYDDKVIYLHQRGLMNQHLKSLKNTKAKSFNRFSRAVIDPVPIADILEKWEAEKPKKKALSNHQRMSISLEPSQQMSNNTFDKRSLENDNYGFQQQSQKSSIKQHISLLKHDPSAQNLEMASVVSQNKQEFEGEYFAKKDEPNVQFCNMDSEQSIFDNETEGILELPDITRKEKRREMSQEIQPVANSRNFISLDASNLSRNSQQELSPSNVHYFSAHKPLSKQSKGQILLNTIGAGGAKNTKSDQNLALAYRVAGKYKNLSNIKPRQLSNESTDMTLLNSQSTHKLNSLVTLSNQRSFKSLKVRPQVNEIQNKNKVEETRIIDQEDNGEAAADYKIPIKKKSKRNQLPSLRKQSQSTIGLPSLQHQKRHFDHVSYIPQGLDISRWDGKIATRKLRQNLSNIVDESHLMRQSITGAFERLENTMEKARFKGRQMDYISNILEEFDNLDPPSLHVIYETKINDKKVSQEDLEEFKAHKLGEILQQGI